MTTSTLIINNHRIPLPDATDLRALQESVVAAIRGGGGFVHVESLPGTHYDVCVTSGSTVIVQSSDFAIELDGLGLDWTQVIDLDL